MQTPLVIVVEDDDTLQQFFGMVLEMLPVSQRLCATAEEALKVLAEGPADVIVTDLLLPGLDGRGLLRRLQSDPVLQGHARTVVMSGSIDDLARRELQGLGAWRVLGKPVTVKEFKTCIKDALGASRESSAVPVPTAITAPRSEWAEVERAAIEEVFGGNTDLFHSYRRATLEQLPKDLIKGDEALSRGDAVGLRHLAHNLKGVLRTLGHHELSLLARQLEEAAEAQRDAAAWASNWQSLRAQLQAFLQASGH